MRRRERRLLGLAAAWALLGSGCDYWRNLTEPKKAEKVDIILSLKDAWTGEALASARCAVDGAEAVNADAEGRIHFPAASTGRKSVACTCASFHERALTLEALPDQGRFDVPMARMGGEHWYPDDPTRQVRIEVDSGNLIFPGDLVIGGLPGDTSGKLFQYAWTSTHHTGLRSLAKVPVRTGPQPGDLVEFTLHLTVTATLAGRTYEVGTDSQSFTLAKNRPPIVKATFTPAPPDTLRVGAGCQEQTANLGLMALDPDGDCRVRVHSRVAASPLGIIDTTAVCHQNLQFVFPIASHEGWPDRSFPSNGTLQVDVYDGNGGKAETTLTVSTISNQHPYIEIEQLDAKPYNLTDQWMKFRIFARDRDTKNMQVVKVDWKNGEAVTYYNARLKGKDFLEDTLQTIWRQPGAYSVEARVEDACGVAHTDTLSIELVDNKVPKVSVSGDRFNPATQEYDVIIEASDGDVASGMDSLIVVLTWGPIVERWIHQDFKAVEGKNIREQVGIPFRPVENATAYEIYVTVSDQFLGTASDTLRLTPKEAFGLP